MAGTRNHNAGPLPPNRNFSNVKKHVVSTIEIFFLKKKTNTPPMRTEKSKHRTKRFGNVRKSNLFENIGDNAVEMSELALMNVTAQLTEEH